MAEAPHLAVETGTLPTIQEKDEEEKRRTEDVGVTQASDVGRHTVEVPDVWLPSLNQAQNAVLDGSSRPSIMPALWSTLKTRLLSSSP